MHANQSRFAPDQTLTTYHLPSWARSSPVKITKYGLRIRTGLLACGLLALIGCGGPKTVPVSGTATLHGKPLDRGIVFFNPDASKGNNARLACRGSIGGGGQYELYTEYLSKVYKGCPV